MKHAGLLLDLYELTMAQSYLAEGIHDRSATFSLYVRALPRGWGYLVAAGLEDALAYLEDLRFDTGELEYLERTGLFTAEFLRYLESVSFSGDVRAVPEGTVFFPDEPVLELTAPMLQAQLAETVILNEIHFQSLVAAKAARYVDVAQGRTLVDFSLRRTHGGEAGMQVARSSHLAGFDSTSNVLAGMAHGIPIAGTMAHSYVEAFSDELAAFRAFARSFPGGSILLIDTYDTLEGARRAAVVGRELAAEGHRLAGVRLDSGDLDDLSRRVRAILDDAGLTETTVFASGGLDEADVARLLRAGAPIDGFGIGARLGTAADSPSLDMAYKLVEFDGRPTLKLSTAKATLPGPKQVWRLASNDAYLRDVLGTADEAPPPGGEPLLRPVMEGGRRTWSETLGDSRTRCAREREALPVASRALEAQPYEVAMSAELAALRERVEAEARARHGLA